MIVEFTGKQSARQRFEVRAVSFTIGSALGTDVRIREPDVPDRLCRVERVPGSTLHWFVRIDDQLPKHGGQRVEVQPGQVLQINNLRLRFIEDEYDTRSCSSCGDPLDESVVMCVSCGMNRKTGKYIDPPGLIPGLTPPMVNDPPASMAWRFLTDLEQTKENVDRDDRAAALRRMIGATIMLATAILFAALHIDGNRPTAPLRFALVQVMSLITQTGLLVAVLLLASAVGNIEFGRVDHAVYKCLCIAASVRSMLFWTPVIVGRFVSPGGLIPVSAIVSAILVSLVAVVVPMGFVKWLFRLDMSDFGIVFALQCAVLMVSAFVFALIG